MTGYLILFPWWECMGLTNYISVKHKRNYVELVFFFNRWLFWSIAGNKICNYVKYTLMNEAKEPNSKMQRWDTDSLNKHDFNIKPGHWMCWGIQVRYCQSLPSSLHNLQKVLILETSNSRLLRRTCFLCWAMERSGLIQASPHEMYTYQRDVSGSWCGRDWNSSE